MLENIRNKEHCVKEYLNLGEGLHTKKKQHLKQLSTFTKLSSLFPKLDISICMKIICIPLKIKILYLNIIKAVLKFMLVTRYRQLFLDKYKPVDTKKENGRQFYFSI